MMNIFNYILFGLVVFWESLNIILRIRKINIEKLRKRYEKRHIYRGSGSFLFGICSSLVCFYTYKNADLRVFWLLLGIFLGTATIIIGIYLIYLFIIDVNKVTHKDEIDKEIVGLPPSFGQKTA